MCVPDLVGNLEDKISYDNGLVGGGGGGGGQGRCERRIKVFVKI